MKLCGSKLAPTISHNFTITVEVYYTNGEIDIFHEGETLSGEDVLPGFTLPVAGIFADPLAD